MPVLAAASGGSGSNNGTFLLIAVVVVLGVLLFVSNRRRRQQTQAQQKSLTIGSEVSTTSGLLGTLVELDERVATVEVSPDVRLRFIRRAVVPRTALLPQSKDGTGEDAEPLQGGTDDGTSGDHTDTRAEA